MVSPRVLKLAEDIKVIAAEMLKRRIKDPRLGFVTLTDVRLTGDSRDAQRVLHGVRDAGGAGQHGGCAALGDRDDPVAGGQAARAEVHPDAGVHPRCRAGDGAAAGGPAGGGQGRRREGGRAGGRGGVRGRAGPVQAARGRRVRRRPTCAPECRQDSSGVLVVDKPAGWTSHQVVGRARRVLGTRKIGHAGTLDPMATGVLVLGVGRATRLLGQLALTDKAYEATVRLGQATVTDDAEGEVTAVARSGRRLRRGDRDRPGRDSGDRSSRCRRRSRRSRSVACARTRGCGPVRT